MSESYATPLEELVECGGALIELDRDWVVVRVNAAQERASGKQRSETVGRVFWEVWPDAAGTAAAREYRRCMDERVRVELEDWYGPLGTWFAITAYPTSTGGIVVFFREATGQKRAEQSLAAERDLRTAVLDTLASLVVVLDTDGRIVRFNKACERATGYTTSEVLGKSVFDLLVPEPDLAGAQATFRQLRTGDFPNQHRNRWRMKDGTQRLLDWSNTAVADERGAVELIIATGIDITDGEHRIEALRASEAKFRSVFEQAAIGMGRVRFADARWIDVNDAFCGMLGRSREEMISTPWPDITHPDDVDVDLVPFRRMAAGEVDSYSVEKRFIHADGHHVWAKLTLSLVRDAEGKPEYEIAIIEDIGDRKRAEHALSESEQRLRAIFEGAGVGIVEVDEEDRFVAVNGPFCAMLGYSCGELLGKRPHDIIDPDDLSATTELNAKGHTGEVGRFDYEKRYLRKDGSPVWVHVTVSVARDEAGRFLRAVGTAEDVSERRRTEVALAESRARIQAALASATDAVFVADRDGHVIEMNDAFVRFHRFASREECEARLDELPRIFEVLLPDGTPASVDEWAISRARRGENVTAAELTLVRRDTGERWIGSFSSAPIRDAHGQIVGTVTVARDVTERKRAEETLRRSEEALREANERLRESDRRKDEFLGMLSHELRNPLAPIRNSLYILDHVEPNGQQARRAKEVASRQVAHLTRLVDDLLDVTRIARGKIDLRRVKLDLGRLARGTAEDYRPLMRERGLDLVLGLPDEALVVDGDETRLSQVLGNLLSNAAKFTPAGGRVAVTVRKGDGRAIVDVRDTGAGIAPDLLPTIFDPFTQAKQTLARSEGGLGLGLALVKGITELHGGCVSATSRGPGTGTEFTLELPLVQGLAAAQPLRGAAGARRVSRVLVVDDNVDAAESLAELVRLFGHEVEVAYDGPSAVAKVDADGPDVVLCDIGLPGMDGYAVARAIRSRLDGKVQLIAVSGYAQPEDVRKSVEAGFDAHVAKPPEPAHIQRLLA